MRETCPCMYSLDDGRSPCFSFTTMREESPTPTHTHTSRCQHHDSKHSHLHVYRTTCIRFGTMSNQMLLWFTGKQYLVSKGIYSSLCSLLIWHYNVASIANDHCYTSIRKVKTLCKNRRKLDHHVNLCQGMIMFHCLLFNQTQCSHLISSSDCRFYNQFNRGYQRRRNYKLQ